MKRFINYLDKLQNQKKLTKTQLYLTAVGILLFLALALTIPNYLLRHQQTMRGQAQQAPTLPPPPQPPMVTNPPSPVTLVAAPSSANTVVGNPFSIDVGVNGDGQQFNAAEATVGVSANLSITGISTPATNHCNFVYTQTPTTADPSFAGAMLGTSSTQCTVYTLHMTPTAAGTGTITFTNASVKAYSDNSEILSYVIDGSYTLTGPTPTNTPVPPNPTNTLVPTHTPVPPTPTHTPVPPTTTPVPLAAPTVNQPASPTYHAVILLQGTKNASLTSIYVNDTPSGITFPTTTTWKAASVPLTLGLNTLTVYGRDASNHQSSSTSVHVTRHRLGDINGDTFIDLTDISLFSTDWRKTTTFNHALSDMNVDASVDLTDFSIIAKQYGQ